MKIRIPIFIFIFLVISCFLLCREKFLSDSEVSINNKIFEIDKSGGLFEQLVNDFTSCSNSKSITKDTFDLWAEDCTFTYVNDRIFIRFPFQTRNGKISLFADIPKIKTNKVNILLAGGPLVEIKEYINFKENSIHNSFINKDVAVIVPNYIGTDKNSMYPNSDTEIASNQIIDLINSKIHNKIHLIGHSAGGFIATLVHRKTDISTTIFGTSLINLRDTNFYRKSIYPETARIFQNDINGNVLNGGEIIDIPYLDFYKTYFGKFYHSNLMNDIIDQQDIKIIYGEKDLLYTISKSHLPNFSAVKDRICLVKGMGHAPESAAEIKGLRECFLNNLVDD